MSLFWDRSNEPRDADEVMQRARESARRVREEEDHRKLEIAREAKRQREAADRLKRKAHWDFLDEQVRLFNEESKRQERLRAKAREEKRVADWVEKFLIANSGEDPKRFGITARDILIYVAHKYELEVPDIVGKYKARRVLTARWEAIRHIYTIFPDKTLGDIGRIFNTQHDSIYHAVRTMGVYRENGPHRKERKPGPYVKRRKQYRLALEQRHRNAQVAGSSHGAP